MRRQDFHYELPEELIAKVPMPERTASRLMVLEGPSGAIAHKSFVDILNLLNPRDLLVFNDTRVIPARVYGHKLTGGRVEILVERILSRHRILAHLRASKSPGDGAILSLENGPEITVVQRHADLFELEFPEASPVLEVLERIGHVPLPPYINRKDELLDRERYQTVYGRKQGAVAAPTAGLHFSEQLLEQIRKRGIGVAFVTLHVGAGTFQPVRVEDIREHTMHSEVMELSADVAEQVRATKAAGGRVIAVGTTSVRCLETAASVANSELVEAYQGDTNIFIYPSYEYKIVDALVTNFHLPESTLLMLVSAFAGYGHIMRAYQEAIAERYRFFSYGDAMFITRNPNAEIDLDPIGIA